MNESTVVEEPNSEQRNFFEKKFPNLIEKVYSLLGGRDKFRRLWNSISLILGRFASSGLGFLTWLITARIYSPDEVGIASGIISSVMLIIQIALIGFNSAFISIYPRYKKDPSQLINTVFNLLILTSAATATIFVKLSSTYFTRLDIVSSSTAYLVIFFSLAIFATLNTLLDFISIGIRQSEQVLTRNFLFGILTIASVAVIPFLTGRAVSAAVITGWVLASLAACIYGGYQIYHAISNFKYRLQINFKITWELITVGIQNYLLTLGERAPNWIIPILVTEVLSPEENAYWYILWMMAWVIYNIPISVGQNLFADLSNQADERKASIFFSMRTSLILAVLGGGAAYLLAPFMLSLMGSEYVDEGVLPLRILVGGALPFTLVQAYYGVCRGIGELKEAIYAGWISGVLNISAVFIVGQLFGLVGIAIALVAIQTLIGVWSLGRIYFLNQNYDLQNIVDSRIDAYLRHR